MKIIGIDPGASGGVCTIHKDRVDVGTLDGFKELSKYMARLKKDSEILVFIEKVQMWLSDVDENRGKAMRTAKLVSHYESLKTVLDLAETPYIEVHPRTWQNYLKEVANVNKKGFKNPKNAYKAFAIEKFPQKLKQINLKTSDAICIAWYGKQVLSRFPSQTLSKVKYKEQLTLFKNGN